MRRDRTVHIVGVFPQEGLEPEEFECHFYGSLSADEALCLAFIEADTFSTSEEE